MGLLGFPNFSVNAFEEAKTGKGFFEPRYTGISFSSGYFPIKIPSMLQSHLSRLEPARIARLPHSPIV